MGKNEGEKTFFLESGIWYTVKQDYKETIDSSVDRILDEAIEIDFPFKKTTLLTKYKHTDKGKKYEYWYNKELVTHYAEQEKEAVLLDRKTVSLPGQTPVEICDILLRGSETEYELIHIKYKYGSSALSHLFSQGNVSAELLADREFRKRANRKINREMRFDTEETFDPRQYTINYGIIAKLGTDRKANIPLFSRINLKIFIDNLRRMQYKVKLSFINCE